MCVHGIFARVNYTVHRVNAAGPPEFAWDSPGWQHAEVIAVACFRPESSAHRPRTTTRLLHDGRHIHGLFEVHDRFVRCRRTEYGSEVWKDACVEFFVEPPGGRGYFNFEFNCGGTFLCAHILDPTRTPEGFRQFTRVPATAARVVTVRASMPPITDPERPDPITWWLQFSIPFALLETFAGPFGKVRGQRWRGNFFKCAEENSHPHWASWSPVDEFNFHRPPCFGDLHFE